MIFGIFCALLVIEVAVIRMAMSLKEIKELLKERETNENP